MLKIFPAIDMMMIIIILACALNVRKYKELQGDIDQHSSCMAICLTQPPILSLIWKLQPFHAPAVWLSVSQLSSYLIISNLTTQVIPSSFIFFWSAPLIWTQWSRSRHHCPVALVQLFSYQSHWKKENSPWSQGLTCQFLVSNGGSS